MLCHKYVFRLFHAPKLEKISTKLSMIVKVAKLITDVLSKNRTGVFLRVLPNISECFFFAKHLWVTASAKYPFLLVKSISATK